MTWFVLLVPLTLLLLGFPIFVILIASSACLLMFFMNVPYAVAHQTLFGAIDKFSLLAVPFFLFAGEIMGVGGMSKRILDWCMSIIGRVRGAQGLTIIGASAGVFSWILTVNGVPQAAVQLVKGLADHPWTVLLAINIFLLIVGCVIDPASATLILTPLLVPICKAYGIDLIHFGVIISLNLAIGMFHPPFGLNIFVVQALTRAPVADIYLGVIPFVVVALIALVIVTYVPWFSLALTTFL